MRTSLTSAWKACCRDQNSAALLILSMFLFSILFSFGAFAQSCTTEASCTNGGAAYCECNGVQATYCVDGATWKVVDYRCEGGSCIASKSSSSTPDQYTCDNGVSVYNPSSETACSDAKDNDYDSLVDCGDGDCVYATNCLSTTTTTTSYTNATTTMTTSQTDTCTYNNYMSSCYCGGTWRSTYGYCCSGVWQTTYCGSGSNATTTTAVSNQTTTTTSYSYNTTNTTTTTYPQTTTTYSYSCSKTNYWYCYNKTDCTGAGASWCGTWCSSSACPTCSSSELWNCYDQTSCGGVGGKWCTGSGSYGWCQSSVCPKCSSTDYWNCYTEMECTGAGAKWCKGSGTSGWCSNTACPTCSSSEPWNCYDKAACTGAGASWCDNTAAAAYPSGSSGWCQSGSCPTYKCTSSEPWNCYSETECKGASAQWCGTYCSSSCPTCSSSQKWNCYTETGCTGAKGNWCSSYCSDSACPTCSKTQPWNCYKETDCTGASGKWCGTYCSDYCPTYKCSTSEAWNCYTETECVGTGAKWCTSQSGGGGWCQKDSCPSYKCSKTEYWNCYNKADCTGAGANWCGTWCTDTKCPTCTSSEPWNCYDKTSCTGASAQWCGTYCSSSCPTCSSTQPWNCYNETDCKGASGKWCLYSSTTAVAPTASSASYVSASTGWCQSSACPSYECNTGNPWNCDTNDKCTGIGANWCTPQYGGAGWCQTSSCPNYKCGSSAPWNCYNEVDCKGASGKWCGTYCSDSCPTCSKSQPWNCYTKSTCGDAGANWCDYQSTGTTYSAASSSPLLPSGWCQESSCPTYECSSKEPWNCYSSDKCSGAGANWCDTSYGGYCSSIKCPTCDSKNVYNCFSKDKCVDVGGSWCKSSGGVDSGWCQSGTCPKCSRDQYWNCYDEASCSAAGVSWCSTGTNYGYCTTSSCPKCDKDSPWNCYTDVNCKGAGGKWCKDIYSYGYGGKDAVSGYCMTKDSFCPSGEATPVPVATTMVSFGCGDGVCGPEEGRKGKEPCKTDCGVDCNFDGVSDSWDCALDTIKPPPGCSMKYDTLTGFSSIACDRFGYEFKCASVKEEHKEMCEQYGGKPVVKTTFDKCEILDCLFEEDGLSGTVFARYGDCPTILEIDEQLDKCESAGGKAILSKKSGCHKISCTFASIEKEKCLEEKDPSIKIRVEAECTANELKTVKDFDVSGCPYTRCVEEDECVREPPQSAFVECEKRGGELILKKDDDGCIGFAQCLTPGTKDDLLIGREEIKEVPGDAEVLNVALKIEGLVQSFNKLAARTKAIGDYYKSTYYEDYVHTSLVIEKSESEKFYKISDMFLSSKEKLEDIKNELSESVEGETGLTVERLIEIKYDIRYISKVLLKDVLFLVLGKSEGVEGVVKECGEDSDCFERALRTCTKATFTPEGDYGSFINTIGVKDGKCVLTAVQNAFGGDLQMTCAVPDYGFGIDDPDSDLLPYCEGSLVDYIHNSSTGQTCPDEKVFAASAKPDDLFEGTVHCQGFYNTCSVPRDWYVVESCEGLGLTRDGADYPTVYNSPNLYVDSSSMVLKAVSHSPTVYSVIIDIRNVGTKDSGPFSYTVRVYNESLGYDQSAKGSGDSIPRADKERFSAEHTFNFTRSGLYNVVLLVDSGTQVLEPFEKDNSINRLWNVVVLSEE